MADEIIIQRATFSPKVKTYWLVGTTIGCVMSVFGIFALPILLPIMAILGDKRLSAMECYLTDRSLVVKRGLLVRFEKTIPLDKITDLGMIQGPIMRHFGLTSMSIETAGSSTPGALVALQGIVDPEAFRDAVLLQKEIQAQTANAATTVSSPATNSNQEQVLVEIRDSLLRIEKRLEANG